MSAASDRGLAPQVQDRQGRVIVTVLTSRRRWHGAVLAVTLAWGACDASAAGEPSADPALAVTGQVAAAVLRNRLFGSKGAMLGLSDHLQAVTPARIQAFFRDHIARRPPIEVQARAASPQPVSTPSAP